MTFGTLYANSFSITFFNTSSALLGALFLSCWHLALASVLHIYIHTCTYIHMYIADSS